MSGDIKLSKNAATAIVVVISTIVLSFAVVTYNSVNNKQTNSNVNSPTGNYKNGSYNAIGAYTSPGGEEAIDVKLKLENSIITEAEVITKATIPASINFQETFAKEFKQYVVGKNIDEVQLDVVSGASLTSKGFNAALELIKQDAKA
jgi:uncharacterized protein with FMN-binding domain